MKRLVFLFCAIISLSFFYGCAPQIINFEANPNTISPGESSKLLWLVSNVNTVNITPGIGYTNPAGTVDVKPATTTDFSITASNVFGDVHKTIKVHVNSASTSTITASAGSGGTISPSGSVSVTNGTNKTFTITPNNGYSISNVKVDNVSQGAISSYTFNNVTSNHTISATFIITPVGTSTITASAGSGGTISPSGSVSVTNGTNKTFTITPNTGYYIASVKVDGSNIGIADPDTVNTYTFNSINSNHTIAVNFSIKKYTITATSGSGGTINPSGGVVVDAGSDKNFAITPNTGYIISDVLVDGISQGAIGSYQFNDVSSDHSISATFENKYSSFNIKLISAYLLDKGDELDSNAELAFTFAYSTNGVDLINIYTTGWENGNIISLPENTTYYLNYSTKVQVQKYANSKIGIVTGMGEDDVLDDDNLGAAAIGFRWNDGNWGIFEQDNCTSQNSGNYYFSLTDENYSTKVRLYFSVSITD